MRKIVYQRRKDGNAATDCRLKEIVASFFFGDLQKLSAVCCDQLFVRGHNALTGEKGTLGEIVGDLGTADDLDHNGDLFVLFNNGKVVDDAIGKGRIGEGADVYDVLDLDLFSRMCFEQGTVFCQHFCGAASYGTEA